MRVDESLVFIRAVFDIRLNEKLCAGDQDPREIVEQLARHDFAFGVALFPPRVWEVDKNGGHARRGESGKRMARVLGKYPPTVSEPARRETPIDDRRPLATDLESDHPLARFGNQPFEDEAPPTRADLQLDGLLTRPDQNARIDPIPLRQSGRIGINVCLGHGRQPYLRSCSVK